MILNIYTENQVWHQKEKTMKKVLILGITGAFGAHMAEALRADGWQLRALMRRPETLPVGFQGIEVIPGDVMDASALRQALEGVDMVVYGINPAHYDWKDKALPWLEHTLSAIETHALVFVFPGNVYVFDPQRQTCFDEADPFSPVSAKGQIRCEMEKRLQEASQRGLQVINLRLGDFFSPHLPSSWLAAVLKPEQKSNVLRAPGPVDLRHSWAYLPDVAQTLLLLVRQRERLPAYSVFHFEGYRLTWEEIAQQFEIICQRSVQLKPFPWWLLRLISPFSVLFAGLLEMRYLWEYRLDLNQAKLTEFLGQKPPHTPWQRALENALQHKSPERRSASV